MYCTNCGNVLQEDARYCTTCGAENKDYKTIHVNPVDAEMSTSNHENENKGNTKWLLLIPAILILCLISIFLVKKYAEDHPRVEYQTYSYIYDYKDDNDYITLI